MGHPVTDFLTDTPWSTASIHWFNADWSPRNYARLTRPADGKTAILMKSPPDGSPDVLIGHEITKWSLMNKHFHMIGLTVPQIYKEDLTLGLILMQDFGDETIVDKGLDAYLKATDILIHMRDHPQALETALIRYEDTHVYKALRFYPSYILRDDSLTQDWFDAWKAIENSLPPCPRALTHIDFHPLNLMWVDGKIGIIDFQAACNGPFVYDIVNLLEDIRRDVPNDIKQACKDRYCSGLSVDDKTAFDAWYPVISAQFFARILGQIKYLSLEKGRTDLNQYFEPVYQRWERLILQEHALSPVATFLQNTTTQALAKNV